MCDVTVTVRFTRHAQAKFALLMTHGFPVSEEQVRTAVTSPERLEFHGGERIAQRQISDTHVLRVVHRIEGATVVVITFYPGRRERYENRV